MGWTAQEANDLRDAAKAFHRAAPWESLTEGEVLTVQVDLERSWDTTVVGAVGLVNGVIMATDGNDIEALEESDDTSITTVRGAPIIQLYYADIDDALINTLGAMGRRFAEGGADGLAAFQPFRSGRISVFGDRVIAVVEAARSGSAIGLSGAPWSSVSPVRERTQITKTPTAAVTLCLVALPCWRESSPQIILGDAGQHPLR